MKLRLVLLLFIFTIPFAYSQNHKLLRGKVLSGQFLLQNVDVINKTTETATRTNNKGEFILAAAVNDSILFYDKDYHLKGIKLSLDNLETNNIIVQIDRKPEELKEVVVHQVNIDWEFDKKWEQLKRDEVAVYRKSKQLKNPGVYDGTITNGMDFVEIGKRLFGKLFKDKEKAAAEIEFKEVAATNFDQKFYTESLKLKKEEIELFLTFCNFDPECKKMLSKNSNELELVDFLYKKSVEFKKINAPE